jgi:hypothetical protein
MRGAGGERCGERFRAAGKPEARHTPDPAGERSAQWKSWRRIVEYVPENSLHLTTGRDFSAMERPDSKKHYRTRNVRSAAAPRRRGLLQAQGALALFDQPARQHGCRVLLDPFIEKSGNLLPKIGRMTEAREFITLQRSARSREQELPRRFGPGTGQGRLLEVEVSEVMAQ